MATCAVTKGRGIPCKDGAAGLLSVFFLNRPFIVTYDGNLISDITEDDGTTGVTLYKYELDNTGNSYVEALEANSDNGTYFNNQTLNLALQTLQDDDLAEIETLAKGRPAAFVQYRNGKVRLVGESRGLDTSGENQSGGDFGDFQGYNLTMVAKETKFAPLVSGYSLADPFGGLTTPPIIVEPAATGS